ncbi:MAG: LysE family translocator [Desulfobacterales bacterium]|jgi:threonine/homoserine/homoserine lactone efflux protein|nr:LysE family translocator [Desulfobacterales bacterium]MDY0378393.1 LysE family translocator [Desulfobacterales bacterium]
MDMHSMICFLGASILLTLAPGPDNIFVVTQGISRGRKAAVFTALGMCSGLSVHTTAAALGISAIFYSSALAFCAVKYAGAAYLMYLAWKAIQDRNALKLKSSVNPLSCFALFRRGFIMNTLNPKVALFFLAFLPQFVSGNSQDVALEMIFLGLIFMVQSVVIFTAIGVLSGQIGNYLLKKPRLARKFSWATAGIFAAIGVRLALAER